MNTQQAKLRWDCRRGMLELDLLLQPFLEKIFPQLTTAEQITFEKLLNYPDQDLYNWLIGHAAPEDIQIANMIQRVRHGV